MSDRIVLIRRGDAEHAQAIIDAFSERTGLGYEDITHGVAFALGPDDHGIEVVTTLNTIDAKWAEHVALGDPGSQPSS